MCLQTDEVVEQQTFGLHVAAEAMNFNSPQGAELALVYNYAKKF